MSALHIEWTHTRLAAVRFPGAAADKYATQFAICLIQFSFKKNEKKKRKIEKKKENVSCVRGT